MRSSEEMVGTGSSETAPLSNAAAVCDSGTAKTLVRPLRLTFRFLVGLATTSLPTIAIDPELDLDPELEDLRDGTTVWDSVRKRFMNIGSENE
jgi:hypothetical protein